MAEIQKHDTEGKCCIQMADHAAALAEKDAEIERLNVVGRAFKRDMESAQQFAIDKEAELTAARQQIKTLRDALESARVNVAYAHQPENCGDHCRNSCRDCVLKNTLDDIDGALASPAPEAPHD